MGLDVYLIRKYDFNKQDPDNYSRDDIAYWRKEYGIVRWFAKNVKSIKEDTEEGHRLEGVRNCIEYRVTKKEYHKLLEDCKKLLLAINNSKKLPKSLIPLKNIFFNEDERELDCIDTYMLEQTYDSLAQNEKYIDWKNDEVIFEIGY